MRLSKPRHLAAVREGELLSHVARALQREKIPVDLPPHLQQLSKQLLLDHMRRGPLPRSLLHQLKQLLRHRLHLGLRRRLCHHVLEPPCQTRNTSHLSQSDHARFFS